MPSVFLLHQSNPLPLKTMARTLPMLNPTINELSESEKRHFYKCEQCGDMVDMRQLG